MTFNPLPRPGPNEHEALAVLAEHGLVLFEGIPNSTGLLRFARSIATVVSHRDGEPDGVTTIANLGREYERSGFVGLPPTNSIRTPTDQV